MNWSSECSIETTIYGTAAGEMEPVEGIVWRHPNLRVAYVAQHAFHHIEQHLDKTPNQVCAADCCCICSAQLLLNSSHCQPSCHFFVVCQHTSCEDKCSTSCYSPALQYIQWRYAIGEDREALTKVNRKTTDEDQKSMDAVHGELCGRNLLFCTLCGLLLVRRRSSAGRHQVVQCINAHMSPHMLLTSPVLICCSL